MPIGVTILHNYVYVPSNNLLPRKQNYFLLERVLLSSKTIWGIAPLHLSNQMKITISMHFTDKITNPKISTCRWRCPSWTITPARGQPTSHRYHRQCCARFAFHWLSHQLRWMLSKLQCQCIKYSSSRCSVLVESLNGTDAPICMCRRNLNKFVD